MTNNPYQHLYEGNYELSLYELHQLIEQQHLADIKQSNQPSNEEY